VKLPVVLACVLFLAYGAGAAPNQSGESKPLGEGTPGDDDSRINPDEILAPSVDSDEPTWVPIYKEAENPATIECGGRKACEDYKQEETRQEESKTSTATAAEAPR
jgi:hypothetical protein